MSITEGLKESPRWFCLFILFFHLVYLFALSFFGSVLVVRAIQSLSAGIQPMSSLPGSSPRIRELHRRRRGKTVAVRGHGTAGEPAHQGSSRLSEGEMESTGLHGSASGPLCMLNPQTFVGLLTMRVIL